MARNMRPIKTVRFRRGRRRDDGTGIVVPHHVKRRQLTLCRLRRRVKPSALTVPSWSNFPPRCRAVRDLFTPEELVRDPNRCTVLRSMTPI